MRRAPNSRIIEETLVFHPQLSFQCWKNYISSLQKKALLSKTFTQKKFQKCMHGLDFDHYKTLLLLNIFLSSLLAFPFFADRAHHDFCIYVCYLLRLMASLKLHRKFLREISIEDLHPLDLDLELIVTICQVFQI